MKKKPWFAQTLAGKQANVSNLRSKIGGYATALGLTPEEITEILALCDAFTRALAFTDQARATMQAATQWRDSVFNGDPAAGMAPPAPEFNAAADVPYPYGVVKQYVNLRDSILLKKGYTPAIGEDLGLIGSNETPKNPDNVAPSLKLTTAAGYRINVGGSMQGMDAMRMEYAPKGGTFRQITFLTTTPGGFNITPEVPGKPETGHVRAVFVKKNADYGQYSADYPVTVS